MIRAALYAWNRGALVVADDATMPPTIVEVLPFDDAGEVRFHDLARVLATHNVDRLLCVDAPVFPELARALAGRLRGAAETAGLEVVVVDDGRRKGQRGAAAKLCPRGSAPEAVRDALAMVLANMAAPVAP